MSNPLQILHRALAAPAAEEYRWESLLAAMRTLVSTPPNPEVEQLLLAVVRFEEEFRLDRSSELPHSMSPEEMLKSLAIQALGGWTGLTHLAEIERVQARADSPVLSGIARTVIHRAQRAQKQATGLEEVAEISSESPAGL